MRFIQIAAILAALCAACSSRKKIPGTVDFVCKDGQTLTAVFRPKGKDQVLLKLGDGRSMTLPQVRSGPGMRYATRDEKLVFWTKGEALFFEEDGEVTFAECIPA